ncbi:hypothetical protein HER10_EVM0008864 [Colletotrichum scovillei]|uniref:uncharacterized protein n=1 Tax=Colletotrichum scovillei TaxID=1209932 RepID=UPI0015C3DEE9|nr:uncharacterized protein HER10_EVM0008864 [Colletotrichum scovillei]KAF4772735.1 hypothetical protein HER10_EVM0008864 [Colletotrichum scovillei]KAG7038437.1 hypothetical protein JMJ78_0000973 [Colletotrichum scovillei]
MGSCFSKPQPRRGHEPDFGHVPVGNASHTIRDAHGGSQAPLFPLPDEALPAYPVEERSKADIIRLVQEANKENAFRPLQEKVYQVYMDENHKQDAKARRCIKLVGAFLRLLAVAYGCEMSFFFTSYSNSDGVYVSEAKSKMAEALNQLFKTSSWDGAVAIVEDSQTLQNMGFQEWMRKLVIDEKNKSAMKRMSDVEMHNRLLNHVREEKIGFWQGWRAKDLTLEKLVAVYDTAVEEARAQPKLRNSVRFTIERSIALQSRLSNDEESHPTNVILLTASPLEIKEAELIKKQLKAVKGGGSEFSIQVVLFDGNLSKEVAKYHRQLDEQQSGDRDIYSTISFDEAKLLGEGLSSLALSTILNGHSREVARRKLSADQKYGIHGGATFKLPAVAELQKALGLETSRSEEQTPVFGDEQAPVVDLKEAGDGKV